MICLKNTYGKGFDSLKPGNGWILVTDDGPTGICGQSMETTSPHSVLMLFENEEKMREHLKNKVYRNGSNERVVSGVVDSYGIFYIDDFRQKGN